MTMTEMRNTYIVAAHRRKRTEIVYGQDSKHVWNLLQDIRFLENIVVLQICAVRNYNLNQLLLIIILGVYLVHSGWSLIFRSVLAYLFSVQRSWECSTYYAKWVYVHQQSSSVFLFKHCISIQFDNEKEQDFFLFYLCIQACKWIGYPIRPDPIRG